MAACSECISCEGFLPVLVPSVDDVEQSSRLVVSAHGFEVWVGVGVEADRPAHLELGLEIIDLGRVIPDYVLVTILETNVLSFPFVVLPVTCDSGGVRI